jgi:hypothetical protein
MTPISLPEQDWMASAVHDSTHNYVFVIEDGMHAEVWWVLCWRAEGFGV